MNDPMSNIASNDRTEPPVPLWGRFGVTATQAATMMGCSRSTFFQRVKDGMYPKAARDGLWNVSQLRECREKLAQS